MAISLNGSSSVPQPKKASLNEYTDEIETTNESINGAQQRNRIGAKKVVEYELDFLSPADYQAMVTLRQSGTVTYSNPNSNRSGGTFAFTGLMTINEKPYTAGLTLLKGMTVKIRET